VGKQLKETCDNHSSGRLEAGKNTLKKQQKKGGEKDSTGRTSFTEKLERGGEQGKENWGGDRGDK